jgi:hypothetical protein
LFGTSMGVTTFCCDLDAGDDFAPTGTFVCIMDIIDDEEDLAETWFASVDVAAAAAAAAAVVDTVTNAARFLGLRLSPVVWVAAGDGDGDGAFGCSVPSSSSWSSSSSSQRSMMVL